MKKKIIIGFVSFLTLACITLYVTSRPKLELDGSYSPSKLAIMLGTVSKTDYEAISYEKYQGKKLGVKMLKLSIVYD